MLKTQEQVDRLVRVLNNEDHDCKAEDCQVCCERLEEEQNIKNATNEL